MNRSLIAEALDLEPHPEGGWFRETYRSSVRFEPPGYGAERSAATAIYYLLGPGDESRWHTVRSDELWLWHRGGPLELLLGGDGERPEEAPALADPRVECADLVAWLGSTERTFAVEVPRGEPDVVYAAWRD